MENADITLDTNKTVPERFISKLNDGDSDKNFEDVDHDGCFDGNIDNNTTSKIIYEMQSQDGTMLSKKFSKVTQGPRNIKDLVSKQRSGILLFILNRGDNAPGGFFELLGLILKFLQ